MLRVVTPLARWFVLATMITSSTVGCKNKQEQTEKANSAASAPSSSAKEKANSEAASAKKKDKELEPPPAALVQPVVNPKNRPAYSGPTGGVRGTVTITGDFAPERPELLAKIEDNCLDAKQMFAQVFREGPGRTLADALVAVTGYDGYVPSTTSDVIVKAKGCAFHSRTVAMTFGQRIIVEGIDKRPYVPEILGQPQPAQLFVLPSSPTTSFSPRRPGRFKLVDSMRLYNASDLFILPYATAAVTGLDGHYEIQGIPVGSVKINALLPATGAVAGQDIVIEKGKTLELNLEIAFDRAAWDKLPKEVPLDEIPGPEQQKAKAASPQP